MSVREVEFYQVACDRPGCEVSTATLGGEYSAWGEREHAVDDWIDADGQVLDDGRTFCIDHRVPECEYCDEPREGACTDDGETACAEHRNPGSGDHGA